MVDGDECACETYFTRDDSAQFSFQELVYAQHSVFHVWGSCELRVDGWEKERGITNLSALNYRLSTFSLEFLGDRFKLVALNNVAHLIFAEIAELDAAFKA